MLNHFLRVAKSSVIAFVGRSASVGRGTNPTATLPTSWQANDLLIIVGSSNANFTTPTGWTSIVNSTVAPRAFVCWKIATSSESNVVVTNSGSNTTVSMISYRNTNGTPIDVTSSLTTVSSANSVTAPSVTTTASNDVVVRFACANTGTEAFTSTTSTDAITRRLTYSGPGNIMVVVDSIKAFAGATATVACTISGGATASLSAITFGLKSI